MTMTTSRTRSGKRPADWAEFYRNGPPQEVIVIDDNTPPPSSSSASSSTSSHHHQVPGSGSSSRHYHHRSSHHDPYQLGSSPRSHAMPPPPPTSSHHHSSHAIQSAAGNSSNGAHHHLSGIATFMGPSASESESHESRQSNKRQHSADLRPIGSNGSYSHPTATSSQQHHHQQHSPYHPQTSSHDPHHYGYPGPPYSQSHHYPPHTYPHQRPLPPPQQYRHRHLQQQHPPPQHTTNSAYSNDYGPPPGLAAANLVPQLRKRRKSNLDAKYIAPPPPPLPPPSASHENQDYSAYYHPPASGPSAANHAPTPSRSAPPIIPPWDDKEGHYIVIPNEDLISRYKILRLLGQGTFGKVVECYDRETGRHCAIKIIRAVQKYRDASKIEARVLNTLKRHDPRNSYKCLHLDGCFDYRNHVCMVFELLGQSIYDWLKDNAFCPFPPNQIQHFARQLLSSVAFLHRLRLIHTDLKPENILLANGDYRQVPYRKSPTKTRRILLNPEIRLIDFGSATFQDEHHSTVISTRHYRAPEIILGLGWSYPCDIWSIGCILVEFLTGEALFQTHDNLEHLAMMQAVLGPIPDKLIRASHKSTQKYFVQGKLDYPNEETKRNSRKYVKALRPLRDYAVLPDGSEEGSRFAHDFMDLLSQMLAYDPAERISATQALRHRYFSYVVDENGEVLGV